MVENREELQPRIQQSELEAPSAQGFQFRCNAWLHGKCLNEYIHPEQFFHSL